MLKGFTSNPVGTRNADFVRQYLQAEHIPIIAEDLCGIHPRKVWLDDFGTGFSGLSHLRQVPVDGVKIDKSFIADLQRDPDDLALTTAIIGMAHSLGITVVAEGIEQEAQFNLLRDRGCDLGQGYWFSRPLSPTDMVKLIAAG